MKRPKKTGGNMNSLDGLHIGLALFSLWATGCWWFWERRYNAEVFTSNQVEVLKDRRIEGLAKEADRTRAENARYVAAYMDATVKLKKLEQEHKKCPRIQQ